MLEFYKQMLWHKDRGSMTKMYASYGDDPSDSTNKLARGIPKDLDMWDQASMDKAGLGIYDYTNGVDDVENEVSNRMQWEMVLFLQGVLHSAGSWPTFAPGDSKYSVSEKDIADTLSLPHHVTRTAVLLGMSSKEYLRRLSTCATSKLSLIHI